MVEDGSSGLSRLHSATPGAVHRQVKQQVSSRGSRRGHAGPVCFLGAVKLS